MGGDNMKKTLSILMALLLLWSMALPAAAAETAAAATLRLEKAEGIVKVSNASGKSVTVTDGMRLYSGYTIATEKNSYAYVSLDSTKAVKLDASSKAEVRKSGKKLELNAVSGSLFFNVTAPVDKDESLNIRTSTMVTGVRGTSGWVVVIDRFTSRVHLLEGTLTVTSSEPATGQMRQATITGGQTATAALNKPSQAGSQMSLTVTNLQEKQVPGFVAVEVEKDPALQQKIAAKSRLSIPAIIGDAWARLKNEQASANAADQKIQKDLNNIAADEVDQVFQNTAEDDDDDDDAPSVPPQPDPTPDPTPDLDPVTPDVSLDGPTAAALKAALETPGVTNVTVKNAGANDLSTESYAVSSGQTLDIQSGTFTVGSGQKLEVASGGTLQNSGTVNVAGTANITGTAENSGTITITSTQSVHVLNGGTLTNTGTIQVGTDAQQGLLEISGTLNNTSGSISVAGNSSLTVAGSLNNDRSLTNAGNFSVISTGTFTCKGTYTENRTDQLYAMAKSSDGTVYYLGPAAQMSNWYTGATVTLLGASSGTLSGGTASVSGAVLDLNGRTAELSSSLGIEGDLTLQDSAETKGCLRAGAAVTGYALDNSGTFTMDGVSVECQLYNGGTMTLTDSSVTVSDGYAITNAASTATIQGASVIRSDSSDAIYNQNGAVLYVNGGSVEAPNGYAIHNPGSGYSGDNVKCYLGTAGTADVTITGLRGVWSEMSSQSVTIGKADSPYTVTITGTEEGIHNAAASLTIYDGVSIKADGSPTDSDPYNGCGIYNSGTLTMNGGTVTSDHSCGIKTDTGTVTISGGEVNSPAGTGIEVASGTLNFFDGAVTSDSAGISVLPGSMLNMQDGTITSLYGAGIDMMGGSGTISGGTFTSTHVMGISISGGSLELTGDVTSNGSSHGIQVTGEDAVVEITDGEITCSGNAGMYVTAGTVNISGGKVSSQSDTTIIVNGTTYYSGTVNVSGGTVSNDSDSGTAIGLSGQGKLSITGGTVESNGIGVDADAGTTQISGTGSVTGGSYGIRVNQGSVTISGGTVTLSALLNEDGEIYDGYAVSGPFTFTGGTVRAKTANNVCSTPLDNYVEAQVGEWYVLSRMISSTDELENAFQTLDFVTLYPIDNDMTNIIEGELEIPEGKTVIIPAETTVELYAALSGQGTLINYGTLALENDTGSVDLTSLTLINYGTLTSSSLSTAAVLDNSTKTVTYIGPVADMTWSSTTVQLMADCTVPLTSGGQDVTLDLAGHYFETSKELTGPTLTVGEGASLTITGTTTRIAGYGSSVVTVEQGAELTVAGAAIVNVGSGDGVVVSGGTLTMTGGQITAPANGISNQGGSVTISGGTVTRTSGDGQTGYVVSGPFTFNGGALQSLAVNNAYDSESNVTIPDGYMISSAYDSNATPAYYVTTIVIDQS